jgi:hypothetical protein
LPVKNYYSLVTTTLTVHLISTDTPIFIDHEKIEHYKLSKVAPGEHGRVCGRLWLTVLDSLLIKMEITTLYLVSILINSIRQGVMISYALSIKYQNLPVECIK